MSMIGAFFSRNTAEVKPFLRVDPRTKQRIYGDVYTIDCTWKTKAEARTDSEGLQYITRAIVYHQDPRVKRLDLIKTNGEDRFVEVRDVQMYDMMCIGFDEPEYEAIT